MSHVSDGTLHAYLEGECAPAQVEEVERHLEECPECAARLEEARDDVAGASELLSHLEPRPTPAPSWEELEERAAARSGGDSGAGWWSPALAWAATVALAFGLGWYVAPPGPAPPEASRVALSDRSAEAGRPGVREERRESEPATPPAAAARGTAGDGRADAEAAPPAARAEADRAGAEAPDRATDSPLEQGAGEGAGAGREREEGAERAALDAASAASRVRTLPIGPAEAAAWLGGPLRELPGHRRIAVDVGPPALLPGAEPGRPVVRSVYESPAGGRVVLYQQPLPPPRARRLRAEEAPGEARAAGEKETGSAEGGKGAYRWREEGYLLAVQAPLPADSLRALAGTVR